MSQNQNGISSSFFKPKPKLFFSIELPPWSVVDALPEAALLQGWVGIHAAREDAGRLLEEVPHPRVSRTRIRGESHPGPGGVGPEPVFMAPFYLMFTLLLSGTGKYIKCTPHQKGPQVRFWFPARITAPYEREWSVLSENIKRKKIYGGVLSRKCSKTTFFQQFHSFINFFANFLANLHYWSQ